MDSRGGRLARDRARPAPARAPRRGPARASPDGSRSLASSGWTRAGADSHAIGRAPSGSAGAAARRAYLAPRYVDERPDDEALRRGGGRARAALRGPRPPRSPEPHGRARPSAYVSPLPALPAYADAERSATRGRWSEATAVRASSTVSTVTTSSDGRQEDLVEGGEGAGAGEGLRPGAAVVGLAGDAEEALALERATDAVAPVVRVAGDHEGLVRARGVPQVPQERPHLERPLEVEQAEVHVPDHPRQPVGGEDPGHEAAAPLLGADRQVHVVGVLNGPAREGDVPVVAPARRAR